MQLEDTIEVQKLYASNVIHLIPRLYVIEIVLHSLEGMRVAICYRLADRIVCSNAYKVHTPCVDTNRGNGDIVVLSLFQTLNDFKVQGIDVPIVMPVDFNEVIRETGKFLQLYLTIVYTANNRTSAGST